MLRRELSRNGGFTAVSPALRRPASWAGFDGWRVVHSAGSSACGYLPLNGDDMFDPSAPHIIILLVVVLLLFGSSRLPGAANALGRSMNIFKKSVQGKDENG